MPRRRRFASGGCVFHVLNRAAGRQTLFATDDDYAAFVRVLEQARREVAMRFVAYCVMPNHWHLVLWPEGDDDLSDYLHWLTMTHTQRWHLARGTTGTGPIYQGRYKSFPVETDDHFFAVVRYVERNPLRAGLVSQAENWRWSSLWQWRHERADVQLAPWPLARPAEWLAHVNAPQTEAELAALRACAQRGTPFGNADWRLATAKRLGLVSTLRSAGRPRGPG